MLPAGHIVSLYCVGLSNAAPFCKYYTKLYFDAKHLKEEFNRVWGPKKCPFCPISNAALNFQNMPWSRAFPDKNTPDIDL